MRHLIFLLAFCCAFASASQIYERAVEALEKEAEERYRDGAQSRAYKKGNALSREMGYRNALFRTGMEILKDEEVDEESARMLMKSELAKPENRGRRGRRGRHRHGRPGGFGGGHGHTQPINLPGDICEEDDNAVTCGSEEEEQYRRIDGRCNNLDRPLWGSAGVAFLRMAEPRYQDGVEEPTETCAAQAFGRQYGGGYSGGFDTLYHHGGSYNGWNYWGYGSFSDQDSCCPNTENINLPNPRFISANFHMDSNVPSHLSHMITQMGQFIDHDLTLTPEIEQEHCCDDNNQDGCLALEVEQDDPFYGPLGVRCLEFTRSEPFCEENGGLRRQFNAITAFADASNVYGSDEDTASRLREFRNGLLKTEGDRRLPYTSDTTDDADARDAGDVRSNEMPGLAAMHTVWVREHNRIAEEIRRSGTVQANSAADIDEEIFQRARVALIAEMQKVIYDEYLPKILGQSVVYRAGLALPTVPRNADERVRRTRYNDNINPGIFNGFATAAYRFGHSMIQGLIHLFAVNTNRPRYLDEYPLRDNFFTMKQYDLVMEEILAGLINQPAQANDEFITEEVTTQLFKEVGAAHGSDLAARNIHRARDHGLAGYGAYRQACGLPIPQGDLCSWDDSARPREIPLDRWRNLRDVYSPTPPRDMDVFTAGLAESPEDMEGGAVVGPTFSCMIAAQFRNIRDGDRLFFTHGNNNYYGYPYGRKIENRHRGGRHGGGSWGGGYPGGGSTATDVLTDAQLRTVLGRSFRDILCDNTDITHAQPDVFVVPGNGNRVTACSNGYSALDSSLF